MKRLSKQNSKFNKTTLGNNSSWNTYNGLILKESLELGLMNKLLSKKPTKLVVEKWQKQEQRSKDKLMKRTE